MKIKICGVCRPEDAQYASLAGADYLGVILAKRGPRSLTLARAQDVLARAGDARRVGVFADQPVGDVVDACTRLDLAVAQLHGREAPAYIAELQRNTSSMVWKMVTLEEADDVNRAADLFGDVVNGILIDGPHAGSGSVFDWNLAVHARSTLPPNVQLIIAGGLTPENVRDAVAMMQPDVVDVASGVEENVGRKSKERIDGFIRNALR